MRRTALGSRIVISFCLVGSPTWATPDTHPMTASIPALPSAHDLAGDWMLSWGGERCDLNLSSLPVSMPRPATDAWALTLDEQCTGNDVLAAVRAWRPASDGIDLTDARGRTRLFLSRTGPQAYEAVLPSGQAVRLTRD